MTDDKFRLPGSSYEELCKIIKGYGNSDKPATNTDISKFTGINNTIVSRNNGFLTSIGIIEGGNTKTVTSIGRNLSRALEYEKGDEISSAWREIVRESEFLQSMLKAIKIRKGMDPESLRGHIAYSTGQQKSQPVMTGAKTVIDILQSAELIREEDGRYITANIHDSLPHSEKKSPNPTDDAVKTSIPVNMDVSKGATPLTSDLGTHGGSVSLHIELRIDAKPADLDGLGAKLRQLLKDVTEDSDISAQNASEDAEYTYHEPEEENDASVNQEQD